MYIRDWIKFLITNIWRTSVLQHNEITFGWKIKFSCRENGTKTLARHLNLTQLVWQPANSLCFQKHYCLARTTLELRLQTIEICNRGMFWLIRIVLREKLILIYKKMRFNFKSLFFSDTTNLPAGRFVVFSKTLFFKLYSVWILTL